MSWKVKVSYKWTIGRYSLSKNYKVEKKLLKQMK